VRADRVREKTRDAVSQNSTACAAAPGCLPETSAIEVDVVLGELEIRTAEAIKRFERLPGKSPGIPRKEVIQPQLPLRLPCYDFTPVTDPTFDGSLPCGLGHRLRVLPASVV
jgi:hypothetical protein